jgi:hypothetical protein
VITPFSVLEDGGGGAEYVHASEVRQRLNEYRLEVLPDRV